MNKIKIDNYYEPESKTIRLDEADLNQIDTNTMQILLKENYKLKKENQELKETLRTYQDPEDLTLMFLYCEEKAKDKIKELLAENQILDKKLGQYIEQKDEWIKLLNKYKLQQKEFIEWLETMNRMYQNEYKDIDTAEHYNCVLRKYKEIIGDDK